MKCTFVGHATWLVQSGDATVLLDPLLSADFRDGWFRICPTREVHPAKLPALSAVVISHGHRDHFDPATLATLDRATPVYCPADPVVLHALRRLGYARVETVGERSYARAGALEMVFLPYSSAVPETGVLLSDGKTTFWNQVDTVATPAVIDRVRRQVGSVDLVAHDYQPALETAALRSQSVEFPVQAYAELLQRARLLHPRALAPASAGYRIAGPGRWFNAYKFPVSRERFVRDVALAVPGVRTLVPNPGDVLDVRPGGTRLLRQRSPNGFVRTVRDDTAQTAFRPSGPKPAVRDRNPGRVADAALRATVQGLFERRVAAVCDALGPAHPARVLGAVLEYRVVYPDGEAETWVVDFAGAAPRIARERRGDDTDFVMEVAASTLYAVVVGATRPDVVTLAGLYRTFSRPYRVCAGVVVPMRELYLFAEGEPLRAPEFLWNAVYFESDAELRLMDLELDRLLGVAGPSTRPFWEHEVNRG